MHTHTQVFHITLAESVQQLTTTTSNLLRNSTSKLDKSPEAKTNNKNKNETKTQTRTQQHANKKTNNRTRTKHEPGQITKKKNRI